MHQRELARRPILSATGTYNYKLSLQSGWRKIKAEALVRQRPNHQRHTSGFTDEIHEMEINEDDILVSYHDDVSSLSTNVPVVETIESIIEWAFTDDWFIKEHDQNINKSDLTELLRIATKNQLFQFQLNLYEQLDGVAISSVQGPRVANAFTCKILKQLETENQMFGFYKGDVGDEQHSSFYRFYNRAWRKLQAFLSRHGNNQKWVPPRHESAHEANGHCFIIRTMWTEDINGYYWIPCLAVYSSSHQDLFPTSLPRQPSETTIRKFIASKVSEVSISKKCLRSKNHSSESCCFLKTTVWSANLQT